VPIVQNGQTVQTTVYNLVNSPTQTQTYLTVNNESSLPNSRRIGGGTGVGVTDGGALGQLLIGLNAVSGSLESASQGIIVKNSSTTVTNRSIAVSGAGLSVTNATGVSGNPTLALSGTNASLASLSATGFVTISGSTLTTATITGTSNQITVTGGDASSTPTISIANNPIISGTGAITIPIGTTAQRSGTAGALRYNSDLGTFEGYISTGWTTVVNEGVTTFRTSLSGLTPGSATTGAVVLAGTLNPASGGTGANTLTGYVYGNGTSTMTASTTIPASAISGTLGVSVGGTGAASLTGILKGNGTSAFTSATSGTDYAPATSGASILYGNGAGGFSNVTVGSGLSFASGTLSAPAGSGTVTSVSIVSANGFSGSVASATSTPSITLNTSISGLIKGNGTALLSATSGTDYSAGTSALASGIVFSTTSTGTLSIASATNINNTFGSQLGNLFYATPNGTSSTPSFRAIVAADIPTLNQNTTGTAASILDGSANQIPYQSAPSTTAFIPAPTNNTFLSYSGGSFAWAGVSGGVGGDSQIVAGTSIILSPSIGTGTVTVSALPRVLASTANSATPTLNTDNYDMMVITAQSANITSFTTNLTGTPVNGQKLWISITGTAAVGITWGAKFESSTVTLPTTTVTTARLDIGFVWNVATSTWRCVAVA
jgi:hypothetical protein